MLRGLRTESRASWVGIHCRSSCDGGYHTAWEWLHRMRRAMVLPSRSLLTGEVEVNETFIGGVKSGGKRGRGAPG